MNDPDRNLFRLLAGGYVILLVSTWPLWISSGGFPQVPLFHVLIEAPRSIDWGLIVLLIIALLAIALSKDFTYRKRACVISVGLAMADDRDLLLVGFVEARFRIWTAIRAVSVRGTFQVGWPGQLSPFMAIGNSAFCCVRISCGGILDCFRTWLANDSSDCRLCRSDNACLFVLGARTTRPEPSTWSTRLEPVLPGSKRGCLSSTTN